MKPHRASTILVLGILSLVVCAPVGIAAWIMGNRDLEDMEKGIMDPSGRETTAAGRICGMIGAIIFGVALLFGLVIAGIAVSAVYVTRPQ